MSQKNTIKRTDLKPEMLRPAVKPRTLTRKTHEMPRRSLRRTIGIYWYGFRHFSVPAVKFAWNNKRLTLTLVRTYMKIKTDQASTRAGIMLLVTVLGFLGINVDPEFFTDQAETLIEGVISVVAAGTALWAIFKDDEEDDSEGQGE